MMLPHRCTCGEMHDVRSERERSRQSRWDAIRAYIPDVIAAYLPSKFPPALSDHAMHGAGDTYTVPYTGQYTITILFPLNSGSTGVASVANAPGGTLSTISATGGVQGARRIGMLTAGTVLTLTQTAAVSDSGATAYVTFASTTANPQ